MIDPNISNQQLRDIINKTFNDSELRTLCFDLGIPYEDLGGGSKAARVVELIRYCERHNRTDDLILYLQRKRPSAFEQLPPDQTSPEQKYQSPVQQRPIDYAAEDVSGPFDEPNFASEAMAEENHTPVADVSQAPLDSETDSTQTEEPSDFNLFQTIEPHNGSLLTAQHGVQIYGLVTQQPWNLPVDAFVLPLDYGAEYSPGRFAIALEAALEGSTAVDLYDAFEETLSIQNQPELAPETPFFLMGDPPSDFWTLPTTERRIIAATAGDSVGFSLENAAAAVEAIIQLAIDNDCRKITIPILGAGAGGLPETAAALKMLDAILDTIPAASGSGPALDEIILTTVIPETLAALRQRFRKRPQAARNDQPVGPDLLQVETAVYALAEMCLLKELEPPLAMGILGGWGSGKSFVMHLMQERVAQLRGRKVTPNSPYIGHIYQIKFDAWTYAKSNLWASLMQTIFYELNAQLTRERELATALGASDEEASLQQILRRGGPLWQVLSYPDLNPQLAQDIINFSHELEPVLQPLPPQEVARAAQAFLHGRPAASDSQPESEDLLWAELRKLKETELQELRKTEKELAEKQADLESARISLRQEVDDEIADEARTAAWQPLKNAFKQQFGAATDTIKNIFITPDTEEAPSLSATIKNTAALGQMIRNNPTEFAAFLLFSLFLLVVMLVAQNLTIRLPALVLSAGSALMAFLRVYDKWVTLIRQSFAAYQLQVEAERNRLEDGREERLQQKLAEQSREYNQAKQIATEAPVPDTNIPSLEEEIATLKARAKRQRQRVGITASYVSLLDFVSSRLDDAIYEKELGLMHQVQRDLQELSDSLTTKGHDLFPRDGARVILYIDDLDRCPPLRVVEVLEAVQLLLKTNLFVVVLAIDVRFITRALETVYQGILTRLGNPSGLDYIEKIIQIPYRIQPIEDEAVGHYLENQMIIAPEEPKLGDEATGTAVTEPTGAQTDTSSGDKEKSEAAAEDQARAETDHEGNGREHEEDLPPEVIEISRPEYESMEKCCQQVSMTPRAIKRLANVYKLLKIIWHYDNSPPPSTHMIDVIMTLLALSERYPNQMRELFESILFEIKNGSMNTLADFIDSQAPESTQETYATQEWRRLRQDARELIADVTLNQIDLKILNQVRSFCFVGDIGYEPDEIMRESKPVRLGNLDNDSAVPSSNSHEKKENS